MPELESRNTGVKHRLGSELKSYLYTSAYLFICFSVIIFYESTVLPVNSTDVLSYGAAAGKALVLGKFILIGEVLKVGQRIDVSTLLHRIAWKLVALMALLVALSIVEELVVGLVHGHSVSDVLAELAAKPWQHWAAPMSLMLMILIPLTSVVELSQELGEGRLKQIFLDRKAA